MAQRYLTFVLTIIAVELGWIGVNLASRPVSAQAAATPVIIRGVELTGTRPFLPVAIVGGYRVPAIDRAVVNVESPRPLQIEAASALPMRAVAPVFIETERPLKVESVPYAGAPRPGE